MKELTVSKIAAGVAIGILAVAAILWLSPQLWDLLFAGPRVPVN